MTKMKILGVKTDSSYYNPILFCIGRTLDCVSKLNFNLSSKDLFSSLCMSQCNIGTCYIPIFQSNSIPVFYATFHFLTLYSNFTILQYYNVSILCLGWWLDCISTTPFSARPASGEHIRHVYECVNIFQISVNILQTSTRPTSGEHIFKICCLQRKYYFDTP